jgi:hypothetical protein
MSDLIPIERIESKILFIRGQKILLDRELAELYGVENKYLIRTVKRNIKRFPDDFMFQLDNKEFTILKCQFGTSSWGGRRTNPYAFTEQGIAMLSGILNSDRAITVNIAIMRVFVQIRRMIKKDELINIRLEDIEDRLGTQEFQTLAIIDQLGSIKKKLHSPKNNKPKIGFKP